MSEIARILMGYAENVISPSVIYPAGRKARLNEVKDEDLGDYEVSSSLLEDQPVCIFIVYKGSAGQVSERLVTLRSVKQTSEGHVIFYAYCHERKALRTFRMDRIQEAIFPVTGEVIETQQELVEALCIKNLPSKSTLAAIEKCKHALNVLVFLARCDGEYHSSEEDVIIHFLMNECFDYDLQEEVLFRYLKRICPDKEIFYTSINILHKKRKLDKVARYAVQLIEADGVITDAEHELLNSLNEKLADLV